MNTPSDHLSPTMGPGSDGVQPSLAKIRHGLRTPINHIIGYAEILLEEGADKLPGGFLADLERIRSGGHILLTLVNQQFSEDRFTAETEPRALCHKLRTPVTHIIGYGEMLAEQCDDFGHPEFKPDLEKIVRAGHAWLALMEQQVTTGAGLQKTRERREEGRAPKHAEASALIEMAMERSWSSPPARTEHLLLADDDQSNRDLLRRRLERLGYRITVCGDGAQALTLAREVSPDLILLDMLMPILDGHEVLARIKADDALRHLPVIMISALDEVDRVAHCIELGAEDYLAKPFDPALLRARVGAALEKKRLRDVERVYLQQIQEERRRSDHLLLNILPQPIADRLKSGEARIVNSFDEVTVLFADLVGFTSLAASVVPTRLVKLLDEIFSSFDEITRRYSLEKIKTIGDAYMAAAGLPFPHDDHARAAAEAALAMHAAIDGFSASEGFALKLRIGLCTGPVIAGIIGKNKFTYDLWGDTVNTASRMESQGLPGMTQVPAATYERLRGRFAFVERGCIEIKGKGPMTTYFLCSP